MSDVSAVAPASLTVGQLNLIARKYGIASGKSFADVGCGAGDWVHAQRARGRNVFGMDEKGKLTREPDAVFSIGSPAAAVPWDAHSLDCILLRSVSVLGQPEFGPERMISLANLGSSLKPRGRLLIPAMGMTAAEIDSWKKKLDVFPGTMSTRTLTPGLWGLITLNFLIGRVGPTPVIEFRVNRKTSSRLDWHKIARDAVLGRLNQPAAA